MKNLVLGLVVVFLLIVGGGIGAILWLDSDFEYSVNDAVVVVGHRINPGSFLPDTEEVITAEFTYPWLVDFNIAGFHNVDLTLRRGRRTTYTTTGVYVIYPMDYIEVEFATHPFPDFAPMDFVANSSIVCDTTPVRFTNGRPDLDNMDVGMFPVELALGEMMFLSAVNVVDTTPPVAVLRTITILMGQEVDATDFVVSVFDESPIGVVDFLHELYLFTPGEQTVEILIADIHGNSAVFETSLYILPNEIPPTIEGTRDLEIPLGSNIMFRQGVIATDAFGRPITFTVDTGDFNIDARGRYTVTYHAVDAWGMTAEATIVVYVIDTDPAWVHERVDEILAGILRDDMTQVEQARVIFNWVTNNVFFSGGISRESVYEGAEQALRHRRGNCFILYSISEVMLTRAGIPNMRIERIPGTRSRHRWNLINPDGLGWHHFDTTPTAGQSFNRFMFTSTQAEEFTRRMFNAGQGRDYYTYDPSLYPEIVR